MTNYRLTMNKDDKRQFNYCFTCGNKLIEDKINTFTCPKSWIHLRIFIDDDIDAEIEFN